MDLEQLTKTQIILLTLLVSFVTSIATGVATVSLMEQAPTDVTRVISRIIERPIETITGGTKVIEQHTVVVSEGERIVGAVKKIEQSLVRMYIVSGRDELTFKGMGIITSKDGVIVADKRIVDKRKDYVAVLSDGTKLSATPSEEQTGQGFFQIEKETDTQTFIPATFAPFDTLVVGQSVVVVSGETSTSIAPGVIAELTPTDDEETASRLRATVNAEGVPLGAPLIDLDGKVIGMPEAVGSQIFLTLKETAGE